MARVSEASSVGRSAGGASALLGGPCSGLSSPGPHAAGRHSGHHAWSHSAGHHSRPHSAGHHLHHGGAATTHHASGLHLTVLPTSVPPVAVSGSSCKKSGEEDHSHDEQDTGNDAHPCQSAVEAVVVVSVLSNDDRRCVRVRWGFLVIRSLRPFLPAYACAHGSVQFRARTIIPPFLVTQGFCLQLRPRG